MNPEIISYHESIPDGAVIAEGKAAYYNGLENNPYQRNTNNWYSWLRGYGFARKADHVKKMN